jgi:NAD-dependent SIR2 family protein deacetylase
VTGRTKRALIFTGAGASLDFGAPSTYALTKAIKSKVLTDEWMQQCGSDCAYLKIADVLADYFKGGAASVNFEHIYHCAHELLFTFEPTAGAVNEFRPVLQPFISRRIAFDELALTTLVSRMAELIFAELSAVCAAPKESLAPLTAFIAKVQRDHITRIYTTNYDDFLLQAAPAPGLYTGFDPTPSPDPKGFDGGAFWKAEDTDSLFHLHGSVHMAFGHRLAADTDLGALHWFDDRAEALKNSSYSGSGDRRMDGSQVIRTAVITGLDKLSRLQQQPLSHYYASLARDALTVDVIYVIGSGLGDLHLNT